MIVLDATVVIAYLDRRDPHNDSAVKLLLDHLDEELVISTLTQAEVLVGPAKHGRLAHAERVLERLGVRVLGLSADAAARLAVLRAETGLKMPDCCVLLAAEQEGAALATYDRRLLVVASERGVRGLGAVLDE